MPTIRLSKDSTVSIFWIALAICVILPFIPGLRYLLWPISMLGVYVHELFHGLTAIVVWGEFHDLTVFPDQGGVAYISTYDGLPSALASAGGLLGPAIVGGVLLVMSRRYLASEVALMTLGGVVIATGLIWGASIFTVAFAVIGGGAIVGLSLIPDQMLRNALTQVIGIQLGIENLIDFNYMFTPGFRRGGGFNLSDTGNIAYQLGGTYYIWGALIAVATIAILVFAYRKSHPAG